jgi:hypothetical protein
MWDVCIECLASEDEVALRYCPECGDPYCEDCWGDDEEDLCPGCRAEGSDS